MDYRIVTSLVEEPVTIHGQAAHQDARQNETKTLGGLIDKDKGCEEQVEDGIVKPGLRVPQVIDGCVEADASHDADDYDKDESSLFFSWTDGDDEGGVDGVVEVQKGYYDQYQESCKKVDEGCGGFCFRSFVYNLNCLMHCSE